MPGILDSDIGKQSAHHFTRVNAKAMVVLLKTFYHELNGKFPDQSTSTEALQHESKVLSRVASRILPELRLYSSWLLANSGQLAALQDNDVLGPSIRRLWRIYARAMTAFMASVPIESLQVNIDYLLEEDEDTLGFKPFAHQRTQQRFLQEDGVSIKPKFHDQRVSRLQSNAETLGRLADLLADGMVLDQDEVCFRDPLTIPRPLIGSQVVPIAFEVDGDEFAFKYAGGDSEFEGVGHLEVPSSKMEVGQSSHESWTGTPRTGVLLEESLILRTEMESSDTDKDLSVHHIRDPKDQNDQESFRLQDSPITKTSAVDTLVDKGDISSFNPQGIDSVAALNPFNTTLMDGSPQKLGSGLSLTSSASWMPTPTPKKTEFNLERGNIRSDPMSFLDARSRSNWARNATDSTVFMSSRDLPRSSDED